MAVPKVIVQLYPMMPSDGEDERRARRPLGADSELYNKVIHEWPDIIKEADAMGVWGCSTIEHHLHSEGYEVGPNPGVLNAYWANHITNMRVGALGYVIATNDPWMGTGHVYDINVVRPIFLGDKLVAFTLMDTIRLTET